MKNTLLITSSPRGEASYSLQVASELAKGLGGKVTRLDLWQNPLPAIDEQFVHAVYTPEEDRTSAQRKALEVSDRLIAQLFEADTIVIAAGLINFGMPAALKGWIDLISIKGNTFKYGETGPVGMLAGKRAILVLASGGVYSSGPMAGMNHLEPELHTVLSFLGITDIEVIRLEGIGFGPEAIERALGEARQHSKELVGSAA
jgi:FMN-dependent NADH-azoreductase